MVRRVAALLVVGLVAVAACANGREPESVGDTTLPTLPPSFASTTPPAPTTPDGSTVAPAPSTSTTVAVVLWPLTGLAGGEDPRATLPALAVKIDNHPNARPQSGLTQADVVYEEIVEGITRFFALFHSTISDPVGPIRSARTTDVGLLAPLNRPLFAWSGGNKGVVSALKQANVATDVGASTGNNFKLGGYYRDAGRRAPWNLYTNTTSLWGLTPDGAAAPPPLFGYRPAGVAPAVMPAAGVKLTMASTKVRWLWDAAGQAWVRAQDERPHTDVAGKVIAPQNVVVMFVPYRKSPADPKSPEAVTVGEGAAWVFTAGGVVQGRWSRPDPSKPATLLDSAGQPIALTPGRTWVELAREGGATVIPVGADPASIPYPR